MTFALDLLDMNLLDLNNLLAFSHTHCVAICAVLVPLNLLTTLQSLVLVGRRSQRRVLLLSAVFANLWAMLMLLHVLSWFVIGVVMPPTYILLTLAAVCLGLNTWAVCATAHLYQLGKWGYRRLGLDRLQLLPGQPARNSAGSL
jgi:hypothetical protein